MTPPLITLYAVVLFLCLAILYLTQHKVKVPRKPPPLVAPPPYIGPKFFKCSDAGVTYDEPIPYVDGVPKDQLLWAEVLFGDTLLDAGAGYFHNTGHQSLILKTKLTPKQVVDAIDYYTGYEGDARENGRAPSIYRWIEYDMNAVEAKAMGLRQTSIRIELRREG